MDNPLVSVIIPVFNTEKYLQRCIDSLLAQTYSNIEFLFIDDGSKDGSLRLLEQAKQKDDRIRVFSQKNSGPSAARNKGLEECRGKYVLFCDSDDSVEPEWAKRLIQTAIEHPNAWICCGIRCQDETGKELYTVSTKLHGDPKECYYDLFRKGLSGSCYNKIFTSSVLRMNHICFDKNINRGEDVCFCLDYLACCSEIYSIEDVLYIYNRYSSSVTLTNQIHEDDFETHLMLYKNRLPYISGKNLLNFEKQYWYYLYSDFDNIRSYVGYGKNKRNRICRRIIGDETFQTLLRKYEKGKMNPLVFLSLRCKAYNVFVLMNSIREWMQSLFLTRS